MTPRPPLRVELRKLMQRIEYDRFGGPELMRLRHFELRKLQPDEVTVRVAAASINPMDWKIRNGGMKLVTGFRFPRAMGTDFAGAVDAVGSAVSRFKPGDHVLGSVSMRHSGAFAPMLVTSERLLVKKPESVSFAQAACLPVAGVTAWQALVKTGNLKRGQRLFVNGASGAVGQAAVTLASGMGVEVTGRVGPRSLAWAKSAGLRHVLDYTTPLPADLAGYFDIVFDVHGSLSTSDGNRLAKRSGIIIDIAPTRKKFVSALISRSRKVLFANLKADNLQEVADLAAAEKISILVSMLVPLADAPAVVALLERGERLNGKAVIMFPE